MWLLAELFNALGDLYEALQERKYSRRYRTKGAGRRTGKKTAKAMEEWLDRRRRLR